MAQSHIISAIFLTLVSAIMIQGSVIPTQFFHEETFPNLVNVASLPQFGQLSHNTAASAASTASSAVDGFRSYFDNFRTGLGRYVQIPSEYPVLHRFVHGETWPNFVNPSARVVPNRLGYRAPGYGGYQAPGLGGNSGAASAASSAASG